MKLLVQRAIDWAETPDFLSPRVILIFEVAIMVICLAELRGERSVSPGLGSSLLSWPQPARAKRDIPIPKKSQFSSLKAPLLF
ncbi:MAG: hypothetical protein DKM50_06925 [Candidatus Margulisiibacteriota bacterium]|nr:MAG: hypothetical protein A2X43_10880 [Candidatus Margulisbacteria bacterium GWD2_39_127]PZM79907.1 MAG: hypothetical protein DKM50_06925 [Candidatus Margulisiibacteriota bacterium]HAR62825.1 hypothetical protein [Candidatus Margulisiibacteriota bacterium]HCY35649.1 hypothetical protein [Candidatus Margulisiibacteriota bacterium]